MRTARAAFVALALFALVPAATFGQASITGVVKDTRVPCFRESASRRRARC
jgi:hypothetical protein